MGKLVFANRHNVALAEQNVASLMHRIRKQKAGKGMARSFLFRLNGRVAQQFRLGNQGQERKHKLVQSRDSRMGEDDRLLGIDAARKVVDNHVAHIVLNVFRGIAVGDYLIIGNNNARGNALVLQSHTFLNRAEIMAQVQATGRTIAREHTVLARVYFQVGADFLAALLACFKAIRTHNEQCLFRLILCGIQPHNRGIRCI